ncbi:methyl-accepting chemotaxis protein [Silvimonas sp. JCM 19000]
MSIGQRLVAMIVAAIAALAVISAVGIVQFQREAASLDDLMDNNVDGIVVASALNNDYKVEQIVVERLLLEQNPDARTAGIKQVALLRQQLEESGKKYSATYLDATDKANYESFASQLTALHALLDKVMKATDQGDMATAVMLANGQGVDLASSTEKALTALRDYNVKMAKVSRDEMVREQQQSRLIFIGIALLASVALIIFGSITVTAIRKPLNAMQKVVSDVGRNLDFTLRAPVGRNDEIGTTVKSFNLLLENLQNSFRGVSAQIRQVSAAATDMSRAAAEMSQNAGNTSEAASSMAATVEEVTVSINHVSDRANEANTLSRESGKLAQTGSQVIESTVNKIEGIADTVRSAASQISDLQNMSAQINAVVKVIKEIADQTNLLALNAAIEAARAGEQGRGFAVVADEVRKLAERTSSSTQEISATVGSIQEGAVRAVTSMQAVVNQMEDGVNQARGAGAAIVDIRHGATDMADRVDDISTAISEQSAASNNIAQLVERIAQMSEENSASARTTAGSAQQLHMLAGEMQREVERYRV